MNINSAQIYGVIRILIFSAMAIYTWINFPAVLAIIFTVAAAAGLVAGYHLRQTHLFRK